MQTRLNRDNYPFKLWWAIAACLGLMLLIFGLGPYSEHIVFPPDQGDSWYHWQLADPSVWTRASAWGGYFLHQITIWGLIFYAQTHKETLGYAKGLHPVNIIALLANLGFVLLHILQTKLSYDGLAQDVSIWSSMGSVVIMLIMILVMENQRRGMAFGKRAPFLSEAGRALRKYHGYYFSWAIIYTFWYHPIEITSGHLMGTLYTLLLLLQGSLFLTRTHTNKWWKAALELSVLVHGTMVAYMHVLEGEARGGSPAQFFFGFLTIFIITQMHGLGLSKKTRWLLAFAYVAMAGFYYSANPNDIAELIRVPAAEYFGVALLTAVFWFIMLLISIFNKLFRSTSVRQYQ